MSFMPVVIEIDADSRLHGFKSIMKDDPLPNIAVCLLRLLGNPEFCLFWYLCHCHFCLLVQN